MKQIKYTLAIAAALIFVLFTNNLNAGDIPPKGRTVTGKVIDKKTMEPLPGANVVIQGTLLGAATDHKGEFSIPGILVNEVTLSVSMVGYKSITHKTTMKEDLPALVFELPQALLELGTVVITGTNSSHLYEDVPVKTELITKKQMQQQGAYNLAQSLGLLTGVMVENDCNNCNFTQVRILGFDGKYSQVLIDGDPVVSALGGVYGLEHYPQEMIEQIEVVKGGGSALYGAGAVAGTINMMTKRPAFNRSRIGYSGSTFGSAFDQQIGAVAELVTDAGDAGLFFFGSTRERSSYDRNGDGFTEIGKLGSETIGVNGFFRPFNKSDLQISFHRIVEDRRGGSTLDRPVHESKIAEWTNHSKWGGKIKWVHDLGSSFRYSVNYAFSILKRDSYYGGLSAETPEARLQALSFYGYSENPLHTGGLQLQWMAGKHTVSAGTQYDNDRILDKSVASAAYYVDERFTNLGFFVQDEMLFGDKDQLNIIAGARFDRHSSLENWIISPRVNLMYKLSEALKIRGGYSSGFKAPQIFDEDLHICGLEGTQRVLRNAPGLKEEKSSTISAGFEFIDFVGGIPVLFGLTAFQTELYDAYADRFISSSGSIEFWQRVNSEGANAKGIEFDLGIKPFAGLELRSGFTIKSNLYKNEVADFNTREFLRTPNRFGFIRLSFEISEGFDIFTSARYTGSMYVPHEVAVEGVEEPHLDLVESKEFVEFDVTLSKKLQIFDKVTSVLSIGVKNLTDAFQNDLDHGYTRDPGFVYGPMQPRTFFVNLSLSL